MSNNKRAIETYIGNGLYVSFDGHRVKIHTLRDYEENTVYMAAAEVGAFLAFLKNNGLAIGVLK